MKRTIKLALKEFEEVWENSRTGIKLCDDGVCDLWEIPDNEEVIFLTISSRKMNDSYLLTLDDSGEFPYVVSPDGWKEEILFNASRFLSKNKLKTFYVKVEY